MIVVILNVTMLSVIMLSVIMISVIVQIVILQIAIMLIVVVVNVVAPSNKLMSKIKKKTGDFIKNALELHKFGRFYSKRSSKIQIKPEKIVLSHIFSSRATFSTQRLDLQR